MEKVKVKVRRINDAKLPEYKAYNEGEGGNTGADLFSAVDTIIQPMQWNLISTGLFVEVPPGIDMQIRSKSGMANDYGVVVLNTPGTIDPSYRGEVKVILINLGTSPFEINKGDKIAQAVFSPVYEAEFVEVETLSETSRDTGGFGQSGRR